MSGGGRTGRSRAGGSSGGGSRAAAVTRRRSAGAGSVRLAAGVYLCSAACLVAIGTVAALALGARPVLVGDGAMDPAVAAGDVVLVTGPRGPLRPGVLVAYDRPAGGGPALRRVVLALPGAYRTRADARPADPPDLVAAARVAGVGRLVVPWVGLPLTWLRTRALATLLLWSLGTGAAVAVLLRPAARGTGLAPDRPAPRGPQARQSVALPGGGPAAQDVLPAGPTRRGTRG